MVEYFSFFILLSVIIMGIVMLSNKIKVAYPILLLIAGLGVGFLPNTPNIKIDPHLIFIILFTTLSKLSRLNRPSKTVGNKKTCRFGQVFYRMMRCITVRSDGRCRVQSSILRWSESQRRRLRCRQS